MPRQYANWLYNICAQAQIPQSVCVPSCDAGARRVRVFTMSLRKDCGLDMELINFEVCILADFSVFIGGGY